MGRDNENRLLLECLTDKQSNAKFTPTPEMIVFADAYIETRRNISIACIAVGSPDRNIYYNRPNGWRWNEDFMIWLNEYCKKWVLKHAGDWYLIAVKHAEKGSFHHLEMLMQIAKEFTKPNGLSININTNGETNISTPHAVVFTAVKSECPKP